MPVTPDRHAGAADEEETIYEGRTSGPSAVGGVVYRTDLGRFRMLDAAGAFDPREMTEAQHRALRHLEHLADNDGPMTGFPSGAHEETLPDGSGFPTSITWYDQVGVGRKKIIENTMTYSGGFIATDTYTAYAADGTTVLATFTDTYDYSTSFVTPKRTRTY